MAACFLTHHTLLTAFLLGLASPVFAWPHVFSDEIHSSPMVADLHSDGTPDVIVLTTDGMLNVLGPDDSPTVGWPRLICPPSTIADGQNWVSGSAAVIDLDGNGALEVLQAGFDGTLHVLSASGIEEPGFPIDMGSYSTDTPTVADLDGDDSLEIICRYNPNSIGVWSREGVMRPGWPRAITNAPGGAIDVWSSPCVADLDGDGDLEIVAGDYAGQGYAFHHDGTDVSGWPVELNPSGGFPGWVLSSPASADLDGDGRDEVVIGSDDDRLWVLEGDGTNAFGWPKILPFGFRASPALGDLDGDGDLEIVVGHRNNAGNLVLHAFHHTGAIVSGWPITQFPGGGGYTFGWLSPVLADLTGDGRPEVIAIKERSTSDASRAEVYAFGPSGGAPLPGFPILLQGLAYGAPSIDDFDRDGLAEILIGDLTRRLYKLDLTQGINPANEANEWWRLQKDLAHTGRFMIVDPAMVVDEALAVGAWAWPNPFREGVTLRLGDGSDEQWTVSDAVGRRVLTLTGSTWDARTEWGSRVPYGVYFAMAPSGATVRLVRVP